MFKQLRRIHSEEMALTLMLWLCCLPLVALLVIPFFGLKVAAVVVFIMFLVMMAICWGMCGWKVFTGRDSLR